MKNRSFELRPKKFFQGVANNAPFPDGRKRALAPAQFSPPEGLNCNKNRHVIIGIDPGSRVTGYGIIGVTHQQMEVIDYGCIRPKATLEPPQRYRTIFEALSELLERHKPTALSIETQFVHKNAQSALKLGMARGVATLAATLRAIDVFEYAPSVAKKAVVGNGRASKIQVQSMIKMLLALTTLPEPEDAADALALALCHAHTLSHRH